MPRIEFSSMAGVILIINGYPGVGKLTVAKELVKLLPNARLIDMHLINDSVGAILEEGSERYEKARAEMLIRPTRTLLSSLHPPLPNTPIYVLPTTLSHSSRPLLDPILALHKTFAILHLVLTCSTPVHVSRVLQDRKARHARGKISDEDDVMEMKMEDEILHLVGGPRGAGVGEGRVVGEYEIDTSFLDPPTAAGAVAEYTVEGLRGAGVWLILGRKKRAQEAPVW